MIRCTTKDKFMNQFRNLERLKNTEIVFMQTVGEYLIG